MSEFVKEISGAELETLLAEKDKVFVDFFATWCGPCKMLAPVIDEVAQNHPDVTFVKVDVDRNLDALKAVRRKTATWDMSLPRCSKICFEPAHQTSNGFGSSEAVLHVDCKHKSSPLKHQGCFDRAKSP